MRYYFILRFKTEDDYRDDIATLEEETNRTVDVLRQKMDRIRGKTTSTSTSTSASNAVVR